MEEGITPSCGGVSYMPGEAFYDTLSEMESLQKLLIRVIVENLLGLSGKFR